MLDAVLAAAQARTDKEAGLFDALEAGKTTIELLGLDPSPIDRRLRRCVPQWASAAAEKRTSGLTRLGGVAGEHGERALAREVRHARARRRRDAEPMCGSSTARGAASSRGCTSGSRS